MKSFIKHKDTFPHPVHLLFVGEVEGEWFGHLTKILSESHGGTLLPLRVHVFGRKALKEEIMSFYQASDLLILNSICEAFGKVIIEGLSFRVPVLARNCGGPSEILVHNTTGLLHDSGGCEKYTYRNVMNSFRFSSFIFYVHADQQMMINFQYILSSQDARSRLSSAGCALLADKYLPISYRQKFVSILNS